MIDTDKYEGLNEAIDRIINSDEIGIDDLLADSMAIKDGINELLAEVMRLREIEREWLMMWATLEELNLVADVRKNMTEHGFTFPTDEDVIE